ncbi:unnamed protein product [Bursaphelenchus xylophilus]|uniref:(pine wood nematode) hypothetical protein n=1 Tax=Bursaphelenchus xylophilus TaxID=6326 RepID=A0A7I8WJ23_BURXY|nr:unnamed protein product [Bursaphelenchus xylophilus]CAG9108633.1 unnamed protein product [Bursaphelenchus xylophilus]
MVLPVIQHRLTKINHGTRRTFIRGALCTSLLGCIANLIAGLTNDWLYTSEVLRYFVHPNATYRDDNLMIRWFKNATLGPWYFCFLDPITPFHCNEIDMFSQDDPSDVTSSIESSVRPAFYFVYTSCLLDLLGLVGVFICCMKVKPYTSLFISTTIHILSGIADFMSIIMYMSGVSKEVGNKLFPASEMDDPLFYYSYGYSFISFKIGFMCTETAAILLVLVYMSKRDERTYNRYCIKTIMKNVSDRPAINDQMILNGRYHQHARISQLQRASRSASIDESLNSDMLSFKKLVNSEHSTDSVKSHRRSMLPPFIMPALSAQSEGFM